MSEETLTAPEEADAPPRLSERAAAIVDEWFSATIHNSPVSRLSEALAHMQHARDDLKNRLRILDKEL